ncbi:MAG: isochorismate synthase [Propionibacteriaceae bacterium]
MTWELEPPRLYARTVLVDDLGDLTARLPSTEAFAWLRGGDGMIGAGELVRHKSVSMTDAQQWWSEQLATSVIESELVDGELPGSGLVAFGAFVFDPDNSGDQSTLIVPRTVVGRRDGRCWLTRIDTEPIEPAAMTRAGLPPAAPVRAPRDVTFADGGLSRDDWKVVVAEAVRRIGNPDADVPLAKVVLARSVLASAAEELDPRWLVRQLASEYARCWTYLVDGLVGATPEMLLRRVNGLATSRVLAGTIRRSGDDQQDLALAAALAESSKDLEEHEYAVSSVARALAAHCSGMNVPDAPYVLQLPNVLHLATDVTAVAGGSSLALAAALHPTAAVCGTPTQLARATIAELEHLDRGRYAGPVGWVDARGDGEWAIALRGGQIDHQDPRQIRLFAGCGIVAGSDPAAELAESTAKLLPMHSALTTTP